MTRSQLLGGYMLKTTALMALAMHSVWSVIDLIRPLGLILMDIQAKQFFELPFEKKTKYRLVDAEVNQGYTADGDVSHALRYSQPSITS